MRVSTHPICRRAEPASYDSSDAQPVMPLLALTAVATPVSCFMRLTKARGLPAHGALAEGPHRALASHEKHG